MGWQNFDLSQFSVNLFLNLFSLVFFVMDAYIEFKNWERSYAKAEFDKAYESVVRRLQIHQSELLHFVKPLHDKYIAAARAGNSDKAVRCEKRLIEIYDDYIPRGKAMAMATFEHCAERINERLTFAYDAHNYKVDYDNEFTDANSLYSEFIWRVRQEEKGKGLLLAPYSGVDMFQFFDKLPYSQWGTPKPTVTTPPPGQPRIVRPYFRK